jgi:hypothetical protein
MVEFISDACNYYERGGDKIPHYATNNYKLQGAAVNIHWKTSIHCYSFIYKMPMHRKEVRLRCFFFFLTKGLWGKRAPQQFIKNKSNNCTKERRESLPIYMSH